MTNYQTPIINEIKSRLSDLETFVLVGEYPEDNPLFGKNYPVAFIKDGDESFLFNAGQQVDVTYNLSIFFSVQARTDRIETVTDIQQSIITALLDDFTLGGLGSIYVTDIQKGDFDNTLGKFDIGYNELVTNRQINFEIGVCNYAY